MNKKEILFDRARAKSLAESKLGNEIKVLSDVVNFGSELILTCHDRITVSPDKFVFHKFIVGSSLLKQFVGMLDASVELLKIGHTFPALLPLRSAFEAYLYILLILQNDQDKRARLYYISELHRRRQLYQDGLDDKILPESLKQDLESLRVGGGPRPIPDSVKKELIAQIRSIDRSLARPEYRSHNDEYIAKRGKKRELDWFKALGFDSLWAAAKSVGKDGEYKLIYNSGSRAMHAQSYADQLETVNGISYLKPIRNLNHAHEIVDAVILMGIYAYSAMIKEYFPTEHDLFVTKFLVDWKPFIFSVEPIKYEYSIYSGQ